MLNRWQSTIVDLEGNVVPYAQIHVKLESTQAPAIIYADKAGTAPMPNGVVTADENGYAYFYAGADLYRISSNEPTIDWRDVGILGTAALANTTTSTLDNIVGRVLKVGDYGIGSLTTEVGYDAIRNRSGFYSFAGNPSYDLAPFSSYINVGYHLEGYGFQILMKRMDGGTTVGNDLVVRRCGGGSWGPFVTLYHSGNTTVDPNGFIKAASPIVNLFSNSIEKTEHQEIEEVELERVGVGHYVLHNAPLLSRDGWYIETPKDRNNNIYFYLDYEENETDKTLTIKTYEPDYSSGRAEAGEPVDILEGRFVSLRFEEDPSLYPELEEPETEEE